jgi:beta-lactamase regulating signal transducer with metallopeptidase domain
MNPIADDFLGWLWRCSWQGAVLVLLILAVQAVLGRRLQAKWRFALWWIVLVKLVAPVLPEGRFSLFGAIREGGDRMRHGWIPGGTAVATSQPVTPPARAEVTPHGFSSQSDPMMPVGEQATPTAVKSMEAPALGRFRTTLDADDPARSSAGQPVAPGQVPERKDGLGLSEPQAKRAADSMGVVWLGLWAVGAGVSGLRWVSQNRRFRRRLKRTAQPVSEAVRTQFGRSRERMGVGRDLEVIYSPLVRSPAVYGVCRPMLLLPTSMAADFTEAQLDHVFLHELAHVRRRDPWVNGLMEISQILHWFNPVVWFALHRMRLDRELAADALVLSVAGDSEARAYGHTILQVLEGWVKTGPRGSTVGIMEDPSQIKRRVLAIARYRRPGVGTRWGALLVAVLALVGLTDHRSAAAAGGDGDVLWSGAFAGWQIAGARKEDSDLNEILRMPETIELRGRLVKRLALRMAQALGDGNGATGPWESLLKLALESESVIEIRGNAQRITGWAVGLRLGEGARQALRDAVEKMTSVGGAKILAPRLREGTSWTVVGIGRAALDAVEGRVAAVGAGALLEGTSLGRGEGDLARLVPLFAPGWECPLPLPSWPRVSWVLEAKDGRIHTKARLTYDQILSMELPAWQVPTNHLSDPMVHFKAVRGTDRWFEWLGSKELPVAGGWPKQVFEWTLAGPPWSQFFAAPMDDPRTIIRRVRDAGLGRILRSVGIAGADLEWRSVLDDESVSLVGLPYFQPFLVNGRMGTQRVLLGGLLPPWKAKPIPPDLLAQLEGRPDLLYYEWETTGREVQTARLPGQGGSVRSGTMVVGKLQQLRELDQFRRLLELGKAGKTPPGTRGEVQVPGGRWMDAALPRLGDTITEVTKTGPTELTLERRSQVGLNARELMRWLRWAEEGD